MDVLDAIPADFVLSFTKSFGLYGCYVFKASIDSITIVRYEVRSLLLLEGVKFARKSFVMFFAVLFEEDH